MICLRGKNCPTVGRGSARGNEASRPHPTGVAALPRAERTATDGTADRTRPTMTERERGALIVIGCIACAALLVAFMALFQ